MSEIPFNKQKLTDQLRSFFGGVMFHSGREFLEQNTAPNISVIKTNSPEKIQIEATIRDGSEHKTSLKFNFQTGQFSHSRCSCPYDWTTCKHAAALGLSFVQNAETLLNSEDAIDSKLTETNHRSKPKKAQAAQSVHINKNALELRKISGPSTVSSSTGYYLVIGTRYSLSIDIYLNTEGVWNSWPISPETILQSKEHRPTAKQKVLFEFLCTARSQEGAIDLGNLFSLLRDSDLPVYLGKKSKKNSLVFTDAPKKIAATLYAKQSPRAGFVGSAPHTDFVLRIDEPLYAESIVYSFFGKNHLILIREKKRSIEIHPLSSDLSTLVAAITQEARDNAYSYENTAHTDGSYQWETVLDEKNILDINRIITDSQEAFDLETTLTPNFYTELSDIAAPLISVDYDNTKHTLVVRALIDYGFFKIDIASTIYKSMQGGKTGFKRSLISGREKYHIAVDGNIIRYAPIDHEKEANLFKKFHSDNRYGFTKRIKCVRSGSKNITDYHKNHWPHVQKLGHAIEYTRHELDFFEESFKADVRVDMDAQNDWLTFDVNCYCGKDRVTLEDLKRYIHNKEEFIRMEDGRLMRVSNTKDLERFVLMLESFYQKENDRFEGRAYHAPELENIFTNSPYYNTKIEKSFQKFMKEAQSGRPIEKVKLPASVQKTLRKYQKEGVHWMHFLRKYRFAGILADDMGLGKTLQTLTLLEMNKKTDKPSIVICPKTLLFNWEQETAKFFPNIKTLLIEGTPKERAEKIRHIAEYDLIITSYPSIKKDFPTYDKLGIRFHYCFIDEAQFMKNHKTQNAQVVKRIPADYRLALTGTPLENNVSEIWSIFDFLMPGFLGNYATFVKKFQTPIMKNNDARALNELQKKVSCFMLRRTKEKVLKELPPKVEQTFGCELEEAQNVLYQEILANVKSNIFQTVQEKGFAKSQIHILAGLTKLRQVCNHPALLLKDEDFEAYESAKLKIFEELIDEIISSNRKVLVFSQFTNMLDILQKVLQKKGVEHLYLSGKTKNRKELVEEFNTSTAKKVFLISLKAGGTGLNLTSADNVIIFDPWWNTSVENQAVDRAHRMGQTKSVNVYRLVTKGTIEEKILKLQEKKQFLFDNLVNENKELFKNITWSDIKELFV
ncbi:MAG: DEAD/DEAH box helicase [Candidatus Moranbacteria bacterium]|nr:DEAD/DEAH box helicase [Candidatus Moranbacteria bacterium]